MNESNNANAKKAYEEFNEAIKKYLASRGDGEGLLMDWILVTATHVVDDEGSSTGLAVYIDHEQALHRSLGLAHYALLRIESRVGK